MRQKKSQINTKHITSRTLGTLKHVDRTHLAIRVTAQQRTREIHLIVNITRLLTLFPELMMTESTGGDVETAVAEQLKVHTTITNITVSRY
jgi:hypothetical protein